jgi:hypothetical protein
MDPIGFSAAALMAVAQLGGTEAALAAPDSIEYRTKAAALSARARRGLSTH